jgi:hypothetical protein
MVGAYAVVLFTLPNLSAAFWTSPVDTPAFFSTGEFKRYIAPGNNVLILPYGQVGNGNIWQSTTGFYFRMAGGYLGHRFPRSIYRTFQSFTICTIWPTRRLPANC